MKQIPLVIDYTVEGSQYSAPLPLIKLINNSRQIAHMHRCKQEHSTGSSAQDTKRKTYKFGTEILTANEINTG